MSVIVPTQTEFEALQARVSMLENLQMPLTPTGPSIWHSNSGNGSELATQLNIHTVQKEVIYSVALPDLYGGDVVEAYGTFEVTNPYPYNIMVGRLIILADSPSATTGIELSEAATRNISPNMHHDHIQDFAQYKVPQDVSGKYVNLISYSAASRSVSTSRAKVEQDYGRLFVKVYRVHIMEK